MVTTFFLFFLSRLLGVERGVITSFSLPHWVTLALATPLLQFFELEPDKKKTKFWKAWNIRRHADTQTHRRRDRQAYRHGCRCISSSGWNPPPHVSLISDVIQSSFVRIFLWWSIDSSVTRGRSRDGCLTSHPRIFPSRMTARDVSNSANLLVTGGDEIRRKGVLGQHWPFSHEKYGSR